MYSHVFACNRLPDYESSVCVISLVTLAARATWWVLRKRYVVYTTFLQYALMHCAKFAVEKMRILSFHRQKPALKTAVSVTVCNVLLKHMYLLGMMGYACVSCELISLSCVTVGFRVGPIVC